MNEQLTRYMGPTPEAVGEASIVNMLEALFRNIKLFLVVGCGVLVLALLWIFATPHRYESQSSILVQNARSNILISAGNNNGPTLMKDVTEEQLNSEIEVLRSKDILDEVVSPGWNAKPISSYSTSEIKAHEAGVASLSRRLDTSVARKSNVLLAKIVAPNPTQSQQEMQRLLDAFMARQRKIGRPAGTTSFFARQAEMFKAELADAQAKLAAFQQQQQFVNLSDRETTLTAKLTTSDQLKREAEIQISDLESRIAADNHLLQTLPSRQSTVQRSASLAGALDQLTTQLVALKNQRTELLNKYQPTDRMVKQVQEQISETEAGIRAAKASDAQDASTDINPTWQQLQTDVTMMKAQLNGVHARRQMLFSQIADAQKELNSVEALSPEFTALQHKVAELDNNYQSYLQKRDEAEMADSMDKESLFNFAIVQSPTYSSSPIHPKPLRDSILGVFTALLLASIAVFLVESIRDTASNAAELERWTRYPTLASIPLSGDADGVSQSSRVSNVEHSRGVTESDVATNPSLAYLRSSDAASN